MRVLGVYVLAGLVLSCSAQNSWIDNIANVISLLPGTSEEAPYVLVKTYDSGYEERKYLARKWVCTQRAAANDDGYQSFDFLTLVSYIAGANDKGHLLRPPSNPTIHTRSNLLGQNIPMTIPVSTHKVPSGSSGMYSYRMCIHISVKHQQSPPTPTSKGVFIENRPQITIFTRRIGGFPNDRAWTKERRDLEALVARDGNSVKQDDEYMSVFQLPMQFWSRRNELWLIKN